MNTKSLGCIFWILAAAGSCFRIPKDSSITQREENRKQGGFQEEVSLQKKDLSSWKRQDLASYLAFIGYFLCIWNTRRHVSNSGWFKSISNFLR